ncbi:methyltransferase [Nocardia sp. NRRL S-836]|nr:methyltransferase [Nocardia sp. NRRL S-836]
MFDNTASQSAGRFSALETCYDHVTQGNLTRLGVGSGWNCLEVGGGGGSLGTWLADAVGPTGSVLLTDLAPKIAPDRERPNLTIARHDVVDDDLPEASFDLIHSRLVLLHLPERQQVLKRLVSALKPGGWLVLEEFDCEWTPVLDAPHAGASDLFSKVHGAVLRLLTEAGADVTWGRNVQAAMAQAGLKDVSSTTFAESWAGGGTGAGLHRVNTEQVEDQLIAAGITRESLREFWTLLDDPNFVVNSYPLISARGQRQA